MKQLISLDLLEQNTGQIEGLPSNPRQWTQKDINAIAKSLKETPELFDARPIIVIQHDDRYVILGGNLRYEGCRKNRQDKVPCYVLPTDTPVEKLKEIVVKDNGSFGQWDYDALANEWDSLPLTEWGVPAWNVEEEQEKEQKMTEKLSEMTFESPYYEPSKVPQLRLQDCINTEKFEKKIKALDEYHLSNEQKETLKMFAYRFLKIDFEAVANYYAFNASDEEKKAMERLRLVLVDTQEGGGWIADQLIRIHNYAEEFAKERYE